MINDCQDNLAVPAQQQPTTDAAQQSQQPLNDPVEPQLQAQEAAKPETPSDEFRFGFDEAEFQESMKQVLNSDGDNEESLKGMESMLKSLQGIMQTVGVDGKEGEEDDFSAEAFQKAMHEAGITPPGLGT